MSDVSKVIVGIDPGRHSGWAVLSLDGKRVLEANALLMGSKYDHKNINKAFRVLQRLRDQYAIKCIVIEGQYVGMYRGAVVRLSEIRGWWEAIAAILEIPFEIVQPSSWRKAVFERIPKKDRKQAAKDLVETRFAIAVDDNVSEAILIGLYGILACSQEV